MEKTIRKLGPNTLKVFEVVLTHGTPSSGGTISMSNLEPREVGGGYSVLSRNELVLPFGRDETGSLRWEPAPSVKENKNEILDLIRRLK